MKATRAILVLTFVSGLALGGSIAQEARRHPNLAAAHQLIEQAIDKVTAAQQDNRYDMHGHATKARQLLQQAQQEVLKAAEEATEVNRQRK